MEPNPLLLPPFIDLFYQPWMINDDDDDDDDFGAINGMGKPEYSVGTAPVT
jgi:hypothetical protein